MSLADRTKVWAWVIGGGVMSVRAEIKQATSWYDLCTPWFVVIALAGGFYGYKALYASPPKSDEEKANADKV